MKKFSRILALLLVVLMFATMAVSCKKDDDLDEATAAGTVDGSDGSDGGSGGTGSSTQTNTSTSGNGGSGGNGGNGGNGGSSGNGGSTDSTGTHVIGEDGKVTHTETDQTTDDNYHIDQTITNDQNFIPDEEQGLEKSARRATAASKYNFDENPLINRDRQENKGVMPSFNIDDTGFVRVGSSLKDLNGAGTKLSDLKGKTLKFYGCGEDSIWSYKNNKGEYVSEWEWMSALKKDSSTKLTINMESTFHEYSASKPLQAMNSGKQCDLIYANNVTWPSALNISRSITELTNIDKGTSPGVCKRTMDLLKWGNTYRVIAPIGEVNVLWYNQTLTQELGLSDPHKMWEAGKWNWDSFKKFMLSVPKKNNVGETLYALSMWQSDAAYVFPGTNGDLHIYNLPDNATPAIHNNWGGDTVMEAWEFIADIMNNIQYGNGSKNGGGDGGRYTCYKGLFQGTTLMASTMQVQKYIDTEYSKNVRIHWVPFPESGSKTGRQVAQFRGYGMLIPRKTIKESNVGVALKFAELWASRFTESIFDNLSVYEYHGFDYFMRKQYFDFVTEDALFHMACNDFHGTQIFAETHFYDSLDGYPEYNVKTEASKAKNIVENFVKEQMKFGN